MCEGYSDRALVVFDLNLGPVVDRESTNVRLVGLRHKEGRKQSCKICNYFGRIWYDEEGYLYHSQTSQRRPLMLYSSLDFRQKPTKEHKSHRLGKRSMYPIWSGKLASWQAERSFRGPYTAQTSCCGLRKLGRTPRGCWGRWTRSGRYWQGSWTKRRSAALQHWSPPSQDMSRLVCSSPRTRGPWRILCHIPPPLFHGQTFHRDWKRKGLKKARSPKKQNLFKSCVISKMSTPKRRLSLRRFRISSSTISVAAMLLLCIWKYLLLNSR